MSSVRSAKSLNAKGESFKYGRVSMCSLAFILLLSFTPARGQQDVIHRLNCGGPAIVDGDGNTWKADANSNKVYSTKNSIAGTDNQEIYKTERWDSHIPPDPIVYNLPVTPGTHTVLLHFAEIYFKKAEKRKFGVTIEGKQALQDFDIFAEAGGEDKALVKQFEVYTDDYLNIEFIPIDGFNRPKISAIEVRKEISDHGLLHVVINVPPVIVDFDGDGGADVTIDGSPSHTHEPNQELTKFIWRENGKAFSNKQVPTKWFPTGQHTVSLEIFDDAKPQKSQPDYATFYVATPDEVPGALAFCYLTDNSQKLVNQQQPPDKPDCAREILGLRLEESELDGEKMVRLLATLQSEDTYTLSLVGGGHKKLFVDGGAVSVPYKVKTSDAVEIDARFALGPKGKELPFEVKIEDNDASVFVHHDVSSVPPVINSMTPSKGNEDGGNTVTLSGLGFSPPNKVEVHWGKKVLKGKDLNIKAESITLEAPAGKGTVQVSVKTPNGKSKTRDFFYSQDGPLKIEFKVQDLYDNIKDPTTLAYCHHDSRLYVGTRSGVVYALPINDDDSADKPEKITALTKLYNPEITGIAFNPFDDACNIYVSHSKLFQNNGGKCGFNDKSKYAGQISILEQTGKNKFEHKPLITGLPVSNHDHSVNGLDFDLHGDLYVVVGGNTNAGIVGCKMGGLPESPLSGAVLKAEITKPDFNGKVEYVLRKGEKKNLDPEDQKNGDKVDVVNGVDVIVYGAGLRNPYDLVWTTKDKCYATDNGPNTSFGPASTGPKTQTKEGVGGKDELNLIEEGNYYGHPNRNRGFYDDRQNVYYGYTEKSDKKNGFTGKIEDFPSSVDGICEYRAATFNSAMRGDLICQKWKGTTHRVVLEDDGETVKETTELPEGLKSLDVTTGPGGVIIGAVYQQDKLVIAKPKENEKGLRVWDITPWRSPETGGHPFIIGGNNMKHHDDIQVWIGGEKAVITSISQTKIRGIIPKANPNGDLTEFLDVEVSDGIDKKVLTKAFRYLNEGKKETTEAKKSKKGSKKAKSEKGSKKAKSKKASKKSKKGGSKKMLRG